MKTYNTVLINRARSMRKSMTTAEKYLWFNGLRISSFKFRKQRSFGNYSVDFYCAELKLAIEVDGDSHFNETAFAYAEQRTLFLESLGIKVLRFTNLEVLQQIEAVMETITAEALRIVNPSVAARHLPYCIGETTNSLPCAVGEVARSAGGVKVKARLNTLPTRQWLTG